MLYQSPVSEANLKLGPPGLKVEQPAQEIRGNDLHAIPAYMQYMDSPQPAPGIPQPNLVPYSLHSMDKYPPQYPTAHGYMSTEEIHSFGYFYLSSQGNEMPVVTQNQKPASTRRGPFKDLQARAKTAITRKMGSCIRCRMQRIRVRVTMAYSVVEKS